MHSLKLALLALACIVTFTTGCKSDTSDEAQIRAVVSEAVEYAEAHNTSDLLDLTSNEFIANPGRRTRADVSRVLFVAFKRYGNFKVQHPRYSVSIDDSGREASATIPFLVVREGQDDGELEEITGDPRSWVDAATRAVGDPHTLAIRFVKLRDTWKVKSVEIKGLKRYDAL